MSVVVDRHYTSDESFYVILDSRNATTYMNGSWNSQVLFDFDQSINFDSRAIKLTASVVQFSGANSIYIVNETNNKIRILRVGLGYITYNIPYGNYNALTFAAAFCALAPLFTMTLDTVTQRLTIKHAFYEFILDGTQSTASALMGFDASTSYPSTGLSLTLPFTCCFNGLQSFNISIDNLNTRNIDSLNRCTGSVVQSVPLDPTQPTIQFIRQFDFGFRVYTTIIDCLQISLQDDLERYINLNNAHWKLVLMFTATQDIPRFAHEISFSDVVRSGAAPRPTKSARFIKTSSPPAQV